MYFFGFGVPQNDAKAYKWYRLAAEKGNAEAQNNLGTMYFEGQGAPKNYAKALKWWHLAAEQGFVRAQNNLGSLYSTGGYGVPQNYVKAYKWFLLGGEHVPLLLALMSPSEILLGQQEARAWKAAHPYAVPSH
jgi:hypothetical protein